MDNTEHTYDYNDDGIVISERWLKNGKRHRIGGPAFIRYGVDREIIVEQWFMDDSLHRLDGPASYIRPCVDPWSGMDLAQLASTEYGWYVRGDLLPIDEWLFYSTLTIHEKVELKLKHG